jgi:kinesin family protein 2/24
VFDLASLTSARLIAIAHVTPFLQDALHSSNTFSYISSFNVPLPPKPAKPIFDSLDPRTWSRSECVAWVQQAYEAIDPDFEAERLVT